MTSRTVCGRPHEISIVDAAGKLYLEMTPVLALIKEFDIVLATGHISPAETYAVVEGALKKGITKIVITHAASANSSSKR